MRDLSDKFHPISDPGFAGETLEREVIGPHSENEEPDILRKKAHGQDYVVNRVLVHEPRGRNEKYVAHFFAEFVFYLVDDRCLIFVREAADINTVGDDLERPPETARAGPAAEKSRNGLHDIRRLESPRKKRPQRHHDAFDMLGRVAFLQCKQIRHARIHESEKYGGHTPCVCHHRPDAVVGILPVQLYGLQCGEKLEEGFVEVERPFLQIRHGCVFPHDANAMHQYISYLLDLRQRRVKTVGHHVKFDVRIAVRYLLDCDLGSSDVLGKIRERENKYFPKYIGGAEVAIKE